MSRARAELARRQAELVSSLAAGAPPPPGFDKERVRITAAALRGKRAGAIVRAWPRLARALGPELEPALERHLRELPAAPSSGPLGDGRALARQLAAEARLPWEGRMELLAAEVRYRWPADGRRLPRRAGAGLAWRAWPPALALTVRLPLAGERRVRLP